MSPSSIVSGLCARGGGRMPRMAHGGAVEGGEEAGGQMEDDGTGKAIMEDMMNAFHSKDHMALSHAMEAAFLHHSMKHGVEMKHGR